jgi:hypothetical protein
MEKTSFKCIVNRGDNTGTWEAAVTDFFERHNVVSYQALPATSDAHEMICIQYTESSHD